MREKRHRKFLPLLLQNQSNWVRTSNVKTFKFEPFKMFGREKNTLFMVNKFYKPVFKTPQMWKYANGVQFDVTLGLGFELLSIFRKFEINDLNWYHIMVKGDVFGKFVEEMEVFGD
ncbi:hypothetical protein NPIL_515441 [Nephila pilipes]|uniref:Uncharacterized protein n=1 Tax=Nephila pilipes TaxID=299642 RepID=A0A8X6N1Q8_NEPPI|nr:hypothetical protein NPIL_515441 [Nephila pilipes]